MNTLPKSRYFNSRLVLFAIAVLNFVLIWHASHPTVGACVVCPWFYPWSFSNEPTLLLVAAIALLINRRWSYLWALTIPSYLVASYLLLTLKYNVNIFEGFYHMNPYMQYAYVWEVQYLLALVLLTGSVYNAVKFVRAQRSVKQSSETDAE